MERQQPGRGYSNWIPQTKAFTTYSSLAISNSCSGDSTSSVDSQSGSVATVAGSMLIAKVDWWQQVLCGTVAAVDSMSIRKAIDGSGSDVER